ncbi:MAG: ribonuclease H-like domain-containing protein [Candidatus Nanohaloarchaea archaeon]
MRIENSFIQIPGIGEKTEKKLWKDGITRWSDIEDTDSISERKQKRATRFIKKARKNLEVNNTPFFRSEFDSQHFWRMYRNFEERACFFDIETTGLDRKKNRVTTVSFHMGDSTETLVAGEDLDQDNLREIFHEADIFVSFNGKRFDQPFLEHNFNVSMDKPHIDLMYPARRIGLSGGLKKIEKQLGIERELEDLDGREAVRLWKEYEKGDQESLEKLVKYNRYDTRNLRELLEHVHERLDSKVFRPHLD